MSSVNYFLNFYRKKVTRELLSLFLWTSCEITRYLLSPVSWARFGVISKKVARHYKTQVPTILIISLPRSGSSWVGEVLGSAGNALYLREPITQSYQISGGQLDFFEVSTKVTPTPKYQRFINDAFIALPAFRRYIVNHPQQWSLKDRNQRRLVIKEVNLLALDWFLNTYHPRVIFLVRHPAAVALSFSNLGWTSLQLHERFSESTFLEEQLSAKIKTNANFWEQMGILEGVALQMAIKILENYPEHTVVKYEALCANPLEVFRELFEFAELGWDKQIENIILHKSSEKYLNSKRFGKGAYTTLRSSKNMVDSWRGNISEKNLQLIQSAYFSFDVSLYPISEW